MHKTHLILKEAVQKSKGLQFIHPTSFNKWYTYRTRNLTGFSDVYRTNEGLKHRRKYYIQYNKKSNVQALREVLELIKRDNVSINYTYKIKEVPEDRFFNCIILTTCYTTE